MVHDAKLYYNGVEITQQIALTDCDVIDSAGGQLDSVEATFADYDGLWSRYNPQYDDVLEVTFGGYRSGACFIDEMAQQSGLFVVRARSAPMAALTDMSRSWEAVNLSQLAVDCAGGIGFATSIYGAAAQIYRRVDCQAETPLAFLAGRCRLEGMSLKVYDRRFVLYDTAKYEEQPPALTITAADWRGKYHMTERQRRYTRVVVSDGVISGAFGGGGSVQSYNMFLSDVSEAGRFAKNLFAEDTRGLCELTGSIDLTPTLSGGSVVVVTGCGKADGRYTVGKVQHSLADKLTKLILKKQMG